MKLADRLMLDLKEAMKQKDAIKKAVIQPLRASLITAEKEKKDFLTAEEELTLVRREIKQTSQAISEAEKGNREDIVLQEKAKLSILEGLLPAQLNKEEIRGSLLTAGVSSSLKMGDAMKLAKSLLGTSVDNKLLSEVVKELLTIK